MMSRRIAFAAALILAAPPCATFGLEADRQQPIRIQARHVTTDEASGRTVYQGKVVAIQGSLRITADRVVVRRRNGRIEHVHGTGQPLTLKQKPDPVSPDIHAEARRLEYNVTTGEVELFDEVVITQANDELKSAYVFYRVDGSLMRARAGSGNERVQAVLHPQPKERQLP